MKLHVIALVLLARWALADKDYYKIMGISRTADEKAIKKAYRKLAATLSPDLHGGDPEYVEKFREVNEAYEVLKDKDKRRVYDRNGEKGVKEYQQQKAQGHGEDMFSHFFGHGQAQERTGPKMFMKLRVSLEDVYNGRELRIQYNRDKICPHCRGSGADDPSYIHECGTCNGKGVIYQRVQIMPGWFQNAEVECDKCHGSGRFIKKTCHLCSGTLTVQNLETIVVFVERGIEDGNQITYTEASNQHPDHKAGDIVFKVGIMEHPLFRRKGNDLEMDLTISVKEALLGFKKELIHLDGRPFEVARRGKVTQNGDKLKLKQKGMPFHGDSSKFGDLLVTLYVDFSHLPDLSPQNYEREMRYDVRVQFVIQGLIKYVQLL